jgi:hypothetical protein
MKMKALTFKQNLELHALLQTFDDDSDCSEPGVEEPKRCEFLK